MADRTIENIEAKLQDASVDLKTKAAILTELRDQLEVLCQASTYASFLAKFVPIFVNILSGPPVFTSTSPEQRVRQCVLEILHRVLEILHRLPLAVDGSGMEAFTIKIVDKCMELVRVENEDNAVLCLKIVMDFCRYHTKSPGVVEKIPSFLDLIIDIFDGMEQTVKDTFDAPAPAASTGITAPGTPNNAGTPGSPATGNSQAMLADAGPEPAHQQQLTRQLNRGMHSFKVISECPIIVVSIFQAHRPLGPKHVNKFTPRIKAMLPLQAGPQRRAHEDAEREGTIFTGVAKEIKAKGQATAYGELITAQVKTMSFLAYILRAFPTSMTDFLPQLPDITVRLLRDVPRSHTATRKELLVAIRHIINFNFRSVFLPVILPLLDPRTLVGDSLTADVTLRPLAYTMLADLIHHVREQLRPDQIARVVEVYVANLTGDDGIEVPGSSYQTMSAKLLLNMAECMSKVEDKKDARFLMMRVLNGIADKFAAMNRAYPNAVKLSRQQLDPANDGAQERFLAEGDQRPDWDEIDIFNAMPIKAVNPKERTNDQVTETKFLFRNILQGLKQFFFQLRNSNPPKIKEEIDSHNAPQQWSELSCGFEAEEVEVLIKLFREGAICFQYYAPLDSSAETDTSSAENSLNLSLTANSKEEKDLLETFATIFHHLDPAAFHEVFASGTPSGMAFLYEQSFKHRALLHIPQFLLASEATSPAFCGMLLQFLMSKLEEIGQSDDARSSVLLRLFKLSFMAVTLFSQHNEGVLLPHVRELITRAIELSVTAKYPTNYFGLLRSLFRSIGGGRFEHLYKEILPLLEMLLEVLNTQLAAAPDAATRDLFVELSLTVPARLSHLLPHLSYLMRPLTVALRSAEQPFVPGQRGHHSERSTIEIRGSGSNELTAQGLRTLELCVDNLTADYLDPIMQPWMGDIMGSLWKMLRPHSLTSSNINVAGAPTPPSTGHQGAHTAVRILGKLGGRNRRFLTDPFDLEWRIYADDEASYGVRFIGTVSNGGERAMPARLGVATAIEKLWEAPKAAAQKASDEYHKRQSLKLIISHVKLLIGSDSAPDDLARLVRLQADDMAVKNFESGSDLFSISERSRSTAKRDVQQEVLLDLIKALMFATSIDYLADEATKFLHGVYCHFMLVELGVSGAREKHRKRPFDVRSGEGPVFIDTSILAEAICQTLASDMKDVRATSEAAMQSCLKIAATIFGSQEKAECLPFFSRLAEIFSHACYEQEWFTKFSGSNGIKIMIDKEQMAFSDAWVADRMGDMLRGLLYVIKDMPQDLPANIRVQSKDAIIALVKRFGESGLEKKQDLENKDSKINMLANRLTAEVSHMNRHVREAAQLALRTLASALDMPHYELVAPVKELVVGPIFNKPLRALPFAAQIGYIDAINFLLDVPIDKEILPMDDSLNRCLSETLVLVDADDETLAPKPYEYRTAESIVGLRVAGLRLLTAAIKLPSFNASNAQATQGSNTPPNVQHRARVISIFFKSLYSKNKEVASAANAGLKIVLQSTSKLPKDLLQNGLRPILMNVQDPRKLSVEGLEGLRTLLQLLHNYFKVEIGTRLLDHMKHIADPQTLQKVSFSLVEASPKMKVVTAIFSVFHLLPVQAAQFLEDLVNRVLSLEEALRRTRSSPFREPLIKYLNHYPNETWTYFSERLKDASRGRFFAQILADDESGPLREKVIKEIDGFVNFFAPNSTGTDAEKAQASINAIRVAHAICKYPKPGKSLMENQKARDALLDAAKTLQKQQRRQAIPNHLRLAVTQSAEQLMEVMIVYLTQHPDDLDCLFDICDSCTSGELQTCAAFYKYLYGQVITSESTEYQRKVMKRCVEIYTAKGTSQKLKWFAFHNLLNPIIANDVMKNWDSLFLPNNKGTPLFDKAMTEEIHNKLWKPQSVADVSEEIAPGGDHTRLELIQTSSFLVKHHHAILQDTRKDLIKFAWNYIRLEDTIDKLASYCLIAYFIHHYDTPSKIVMQVYNSLLRAHQTEGRSIVMQSLEVMEPVLKKRLGGSEGKQSMWARIPKKILSEEIGNVQQLTSIYHFVVRHPELFYDAREAYASVIIPSISKVAQQPSPSVESRKLALNLFTLLWQWEERTVREQGSLAGDDPANPDKSVEKKRGAVASQPLRLAFIKYMVQFIATLPERFPVSSPRTRDESPALGAPPVAETVVKSLDLLAKLLSPPYWDDLDVDSMFPKVTEQILCFEHKQEEKEKPEVWTTRMINTIQILKVLMASRPDEWVVARLPQLQKLLAKSLRSENNDIQDALHSAELPDSVVSDRLVPILQRALAVIPVTPPEDELPDADSPTEEFLTFLSTTAGDLLNNGSHTPGINILWFVAQRKPADIDTHNSTLLKTLQTKLAKDHLAALMSPQQQAQQAAQGGQIHSPASLEFDVTVKMIIKVIDMLSVRISTLGEQRRPYLSVLASLVERSNNNPLCEKILSQVEDWVFHPTEPVPTLKEKTAVLQKMLLFEQRPDPTLYTKFMDLVIRIYEDPKITRSELAVRMEHAFLIGLRSQDIDMRARFTSIYDRALSRSTSNRFFKLISEQQWDVLQDSFWLSQIIQLMFGSFDQNALLHLHPEDFRCVPVSKVFGTSTGDTRLGDVLVDDGLEDLLAQEKLFMADMSAVRARDVLGPLADLQHTDWQLAHDIWVAYFPMCWSTLSRDDREDIESGLVALLTKDFHQRQIDRRPNCVSTMLEGIAHAQPRVKFPPHVLKYLARSYDAWYTAATFMEDLTMRPLIDSSTVRESTLDALVEVYAGLEEGDLFYGTWRRRAGYVETNAALSYEQNGIWDKAQNMYEQAQIKARTGSLPYSQGEYMLWEDQWVLCAQKLQQWEILGEFAKHENINDLYLEAMWRNYETWTSTENREHLETVIKAVSDAPTPRRLFFQAFMSLLKLHNKTEQQAEFSRICDENIQLSIKNWHKLPRRITNAHIGLLENFQQLVELHDASIISQSLAQTTAQNLDVKSQELKVLLSTWRDRLPNQWDDINAWQDLVTWRQHIFQLINGTYLTLLPTNSANATGNSYAYRGYHETAWIINRFAHVARKHQMPEVCITQLSKIYTLPNIEIQEAFLKLREQAKCHYQNRSELTSGLDVINNTNLNYFGQQQKAEFYTLKGMFLSRLNQKEEAQDAFGTALFFDIKLPKAWAEWGRYSDNLFKEEPNNVELAGNALSCYLEAAGQYKSAKSRKLLSRILWLLSLDDADGTLSKAYANFKGEQPWWYWVTFIPQLLNNLSRTESEANIAHQILTNLAKTYPQALHFQLRTSHEDMQVIRKSQLVREQKEKAAKAAKQGVGAEASKESPRPKSSHDQSRPGTSNGDQKQAGGTPVDGEIKKEGAEDVKTEEQPKPKKPWDHTEALVVTLRTAFPLMWASMEAMVEQIQRHFKCPPDEDAYRLIVALLNDALSYVGRSPHMFTHDSKLPAQTEANITRFAESILPPHIRKAFEVDFVSKKPTMYDYIMKLRRWRDKLAERLDRRPSTFHLAETTHLSGFRWIWFDEVEIPGQYLLHRDKNQDFVRIERFLPTVDLVRGVASCHRRLKIRGHDGSVHPFAIQHPAPRHSRREERILQLFRIFNSTLSKKKESRRRNLQFHLPAMIPLSPQIRMIQDDESYTSLHAIYDDYCRRNEVDKDEPLIFTMDKMRQITPQKQEQWVNMRIEALNHVQERHVPKDLVRQYFAATYPAYDSFWLFRRQFSYQLAALTYITFTMFMTTRYPNKLNIARATGNVWGSELLPFMLSNRPSFHQPEPVPFRLTPNLQTLMGPIHTEGIFVCALMAIARCLTSDSTGSASTSSAAATTSTTTSAANGTSSDKTNNATSSSSATNNNAAAAAASSSTAAAAAPSSSSSSAESPSNSELEHHLSIFIRDEIAFWYMSSSHRQTVKEHEMREHVQRNAEAIVNKAVAIAKEPSGNNLPASQSVLDLVAKATNPEKLSQTDLLWMPWL